MSRADHKMSNNKKNASGTTRSNNFVTNFLKKRPNNIGKPVTQRTPEQNIVIENILEKLRLFVEKSSPPIFIDKNNKLSEYQDIKKYVEENIDNALRKQNNGESILDEFSDGAIWIFCSIHSLQKNKSTEFLISSISKCKKWMSELTIEDRRLDRDQKLIVEKCLGDSRLGDFLKNSKNDNILDFLLTY